jgi:Zn-dependent peptidase ImmA (M78 family)
MADLVAWDERYPEWEVGSKRPTFNQLKQLANKLHVPFGYLFLPEPPQEEFPVPDFRTTDDQGPAQVSTELRDTVNRMVQRQVWLSERWRLAGFEPLDFVGSCTTDTPVEDVAESVRAVLNLDYLWARRQSSYSEAIRTLRAHAEAARIVVVINGIVDNNTHRPLDVNEFRGFVLSDTMAPIVFVNGRDVAGAQMFTLAHELAHLWIDQDAVFNLDRTLPAPHTTELFCNRVAAEFLVPRTAILQDIAESEDVQVSTLARRYKVGHMTIARRLLDTGARDRDWFFEFYDQRQQAYIEREEARPDGGNFWNTQNTRLGSVFGGAVVRAVRDGSLAYRDAYLMTGLKGKTLETFAQQMGVAI